MSNIEQGILNVEVPGAVSILLCALCVSVVN
jgi:hypothetical protein